MLLRILSAAAIIAFAALAVMLFNSRGDGVSKGDEVTATLRLLAPIGLALAAALTLWAQFKVPAVLLLVGGVTLLGVALLTEPNLAIWAGLLGDGLLAPMRSGRDALLAIAAGLWLLLLFGAHQGGGEALPADSR